MLQSRCIGRWCHAAGIRISSRMKSTRFQSSRERTLLFADRNIARVRWYVKKEISTSYGGAENAPRSPRETAPDWASYDRRVVGLLYEKRDFGPDLSVADRYALCASFWLLEIIIIGGDLGVGVIVCEWPAILMHPQITPVTTSCGRNFAPKKSTYLI